MGRRPTINLTLPPGMRARRRPNGRTYYFYDKGGRPRKELPLGLDYVQALKKYAEFETTAAPDFHKHITFRYVAERYVVAVLPGKALRHWAADQVPAAGRAPQARAHSVSPRCARPTDRRPRGD